MAVSTPSSFAPAISSICNSTCNLRKPINSHVCPNFFNPISTSNSNPILTLPRLRISHATAVAPKRAYRVLAFSAVADGSSDTYPEAEPNESNAAATISLKHPRRTLLVQFTCGECGERTQRLINRLAYERGLVYVQCAGCLRHHKLADNLGLVVEYDLREETNGESNPSQVG